MFRTAILRSVFRPAAVRAAAPRTLVAAPRFTVAAPPRAAWAGAVRSYAASSGLSKQEVEDRIKALLQGFDKVSAKHTDCGRWTEGGGGPEDKR